MSDLPKYRNPRWLDKENRRIWCEILVADKYHPCNINVGNISEGLVNKDFEAIMEEFGEEVVDENTKIFEEEQNQQIERDQENKEVLFNRMKQETLFEMKLEAFEIDLIKESDNKELKKLIRKAKSILEVQAYSTILIQEELNKNK